MGETRPRVIITWPVTGAVSWGLDIVDADTGRDYAPVTLTVTVNVSPGRGITADLLMITDENDEPQANDGPTLLARNGEGGYRRGSFRFDVAEMRIRPEPNGA